MNSIENIKAPKASESILNGVGYKPLAVGVCHIMKEIKLTNGRISHVDDEDYELLNNYTWYCIDSNRTSYAVRYIRGIDKKYKRMLMHRMIIGDLNCGIDHIDHNGLNNQKNNLRKCNDSQQEANRRPFKNKKTKYIGVFESAKKYHKTYCVVVKIDGKLKHVGTYKTEEEAAIVRDKIVYEMHGEFAYLNFPDKIEEYAKHD